MKKIVSIIGSPREKSMTFQVVDKIISDIKERIEIESVIIKLCEKKSIIARDVRVAFIKQARVFKKMICIILKKKYCRLI